MKKYAFAAFILLIALGALSLTGKGTINVDTSIPSTAPAPLMTQIEIADTPDELRQGLSGRSELPDDYGMLFVFPADGTPAFWMKDMLVPIDLLWITFDGTIVGIEPSVAPETYPETFRPPEPVRYVLEAKAGTAAARGWAVGTKLQIPE